RRGGDVLAPVASRPHPHRHRRRSRDHLRRCDPRHPDLRVVRHDRGGRRARAGRDRRGAAMIAQLPALQVVVPLICAGLCVMPRAAVAGWLVYTFAAVTTLASAAVLAVQVYNDGALEYAVGGWPGPVGIDLVIDRANVPV